MRARVYSLFLLAALLSGLGLTVLLVDAQGRADAAGMNARRSAWSAESAARLNQLETLVVVLEARLVAMQQSAAMALSEHMVTFHYPGTD